MTNTCDVVNRYGIVLAGGEGQRLKPLIHRLRGDKLPKQYMNFIGRKSMLEHTLQRAEKLIFSKRVLTVVNRDHLNFPKVRRQLSRRPKGTVVLQPENKETGPGVLLPLMHLSQRCPDSLVAIFPSDHFIVEEDLFMGHVDFAFRVVEADPSRLVLLGVEPYGPETEYGYILPDEREDPLFPSRGRRVLRFTEKPGAEVAQELVNKGGLWNTLVMVFNAKTLLGLVRQIVPALYWQFQRIGQALGTSKEKEVIEETYRQIGSTNFSKGFLETLPLKSPTSLWVLPVHGVLWSDWGSESRVMDVLQRTGYRERLCVG